MYTVIFAIYLVGALVTDKPVSTVQSSRQDYSLDECKAKIAADGPMLVHAIKEKFNKNVIVKGFCRDESDAGKSTTPVEGEPI